MFEDTRPPRLFALPPGIDFPSALVDGLRARLHGQRPEALAQVCLIVNTRRMARRIRDLFDSGPPCLLPRISLVTEFGAHGSTLPATVSPLRRRLELARLVGKLLDAQPDLAARSNLFDLSDSLATLIDEMQGEGVETETIRSLDVSDLSGHWARAQRFFAIAEQYLSRTGKGLDPLARQRAVVEGLIRQWQSQPPANPVIVAGSTGSRGTTLMLMEAVARLPEGAVVLPGFDFDMPDRVWKDLDQALHSEDHPQFRFRRLLDRLQIEPGAVSRWSDEAPPSPSRNRLISLALRPAPVTDAWRREGPSLSDLDGATRNVTLVEAPSPRAEALAIALRLRQAAETGQTAALITPDRMLTRQVSAALDLWRILPDDSAGIPLQLSPPGRFLRHVAELFSARLDIPAALVLLKHPLCHGGSDRGEHLLRTRELELELRRNGPPYPDAESLRRYAQIAELPKSYSEWLVRCCGQQVAGTLSLREWVDRLTNLAETLSAGSRKDAEPTLWDKNAGQKARDVLSRLEREAEHGDDMNAREFADMLTALLEREEVRDRDAPHPRIMIWGTLEARVMGADLLVLGGLNEGSWPDNPAPDPWLNRRMRDRAGLLLPERRIGLSAHDFQQAAGAREVWLSRARRSEDAETVPARWLNRLTNLLNGLPEQDGPVALAGMRARGEIWLAWAGELECAPSLPAASRPSPRPPIAARPQRLSVTEIGRLIRDPYAVYAKHVLRLRPLDPLVREPDALLRGIVTHDILENFIRDTLDDPSELTADGFLANVKTRLGALVPWPTARKLWQARLERVADEFIAAERARRIDGAPIAFEAGMEHRLEPLGVTLTGRADRIDRTKNGALRIYDYKTGAPPSESQQEAFDKQLLIEASAAERGGFGKLGPAPVAAALFIGLGNSYKEVPAPLDKESPEKVWSDLLTLISAYLLPDQGFTSRRMLHRDRDVGDYDQLARFGEWDRTATPLPEDLT